ncbi:MAG TPA: plasmid pRiA4b ORF-3 family protein [Thermoanaerobaculia bacterium]|jgi:hypothetical protein
MHYQLKITLEDVEPDIWRRVLVPSDLTLFELHHVIQIVMGWEDCHLHDFTIKKQRYTLPEYCDGNDMDESETLLGDAVRPRSKFVYHYDFGDDWNHVLLVEKAVKDDTFMIPICIDGERACPPEDSGGPWGYFDKLQALSNPDDEESEELRQWRTPTSTPSCSRRIPSTNNCTVFSSRRAKSEGEPRKVSHSESTRTVPPLSHRNQFLEIGEVFLSPSSSFVSYELVQPRRATGWSSISVCTRRSQAESKSTPEIEVRMSMRFGGWPSCRIRPRWRRSCSTIPRLPNPTRRELRERGLRFSA